MERGNLRGTVQDGLVDSHCHLFLLDRDPAEVVAESRTAGVRALVCVGIDPASSRRSLELAERFRGVFATAGMHPHTARDLDAGAGAAIEEMLGNPLVVAVGETGLDFHRNLSPRADQERAFRAHIGLSRDTGKPLVVHCRDAWPEVLRLLEEGSAERVVLHCFSGDPDVARECAARGYYLSFAGNLTYPRNGHLREAAAAVPLDRILVETDSPFLPPQPLRGRDNAPANVGLVVAAVAQARGEEVGVVARAVSDNARRAFPGLR
ncbi:MAG TPA: TatD family hydrolase [Actinomycetota bacterium]|nr:TatD family hydrolase [Actinomycetota bacterium]